MPSTPRTSITAIKMLLPPWMVDSGKSWAMPSWRGFLSAMVVQYYSTTQVYYVSQSLLKEYPIERERHLYRKWSRFPALLKFHGNPKIWNRPRNERSRVNIQKSHKRSTADIKTLCRNGLPRRAISRENSQSDFYNFYKFPSFDIFLGNVYESWILTPLSFLYRCIVLKCHSTQPRWFIVTELSEKSTPMESGAEREQR